MTSQSKRTRHSAGGIAVPAIFGVNPQAFRSPIKPANVFLQQSYCTT
jgi:hypothetical protein